MNLPDRIVHRSTAARNDPLVGQHGSRECCEPEPAEAEARGTAKSNQDIQQPPLVEWDGIKILEGPRQGPEQPSGDDPVESRESATPGSARVPQAAEEKRQAGAEIIIPVNRQFSFRAREKCARQTAAGIRLRISFQRGDPAHQEHGRRQSEKHKGGYMKAIFPARAPQYSSPRSPEPPESIQYREWKASAWRKLPDGPLRQMRVHGAEDRQLR